MKVQRLTRFYLKGGFITCTLTDPTATGFIQVELEADREYPSEIYARDKDDNILEAHSVSFSITKDDFEGYWELLTLAEDEEDAALREDDWQLLKEQAKEIEALKKENAAFKKENAAFTARYQEIEELREENAALKKENEDLKGGWAVPKGTAFHAFAGLKEGAHRKENAALKDEIKHLKDEIKQLYEALEASEADLIEFGVRPPKPVGRPRGTRNHCGLCGEPGHNRRTCPSHPKTKT